MNEIKERTKNGAMPWKVEALKRKTMDKFTFFADKMSIKETLHVGKNTPSISAHASRRNLQALESAEALKRHDNLFKERS